MKWPTFHNEPLTMYAQINFSEMPNVAGFPASGIFQVFVSDVFGNDDDIFKVVYHQSVINSAKLLNEFPSISLTDNEQPLRGKVYYLSGSADKSLMNNTMDQFDEDLTKLINQELGTSYKSIYNIEKEYRNILWKVLGDDNFFGSRLGGFPAWVQSDNSDNRYPELLLQMDSESGMMWGDAGVALFFGRSKSDYTKTSKDDLYLSWSCY